MSLINLRSISSWRPVATLPRRARWSSGLDSSAVRMSAIDFIGSRARSPARAPENRIQRPWEPPKLTVFLDLQRTIPESATQVKRNRATRPKSAEIRRFWAGQLEMRHAAKLPAEIETERA